MSNVIAYFSFGSSLANLQNVEAVIPTPPHVLPDYGGIPMPLMGGAARRLLSGRLKRSGRQLGVWCFDVFENSASELTTLQRAIMGDLLTASKEMYIITLDEHSEWSSFLVSMDAPYLGQTKNITLNGAPVAVRFEHNGILQYVTKTTTASLTASERLVYGDTTAGGFTMTLPAANAIAANTLVRIVKTVAANTLTIARAGTDTINGGASSLTPTAIHTSITLVSDGVSAWITL